jgi:predicted short-subunit dehydrogenase-like oxidoreductase (DUF2520 family)
MIGVSSVGFIGAGRVGTALAVALDHRGYKIVGASDIDHVGRERLPKLISGCRSYESNQTLADAVELVFITTPDDVIGQVVGEVTWRMDQNVVHCSGALSTEILGPARRAGARVGGFHPLQSFVNVDESLVNLSRTTFAIEAEGELLTTLWDMAGALSGRWIRLRAEDKAIYHASAVIAGNYLAALLQTAVDLWGTLDIPEEKALQALISLCESSIKNIETTGTAGGLTGPIARGDVGTVRKHLAVLKEKAPQVLHVYRLLGLQTVQIAQKKGKIDRRKADEISRLLEQPEGTPNA